MQWLRIPSILLNAFGVTASLNDRRVHRMNSRFSVPVAHIYLRQTERDGGLRRAAKLSRIKAACVSAAGGLRDASISKASLWKLACTVHVFGSE